MPIYFVQIEFHSSITDNWLREFQKKFAAILQKNPNQLTVEKSVPESKVDFKKKIIFHWHPETILLRERLDFRTEPDASLYEHGERMCFFGT